MQLIFYTREKTAIQSSWFNSYRWKPALAAAGLIKPLDPNAKGRRWEKTSYATYSKNRSIHW